MAAASPTVLPMKEVDAPLRDTKPWQRSRAATPASTDQHHHRHRRRRRWRLAIGIGAVEGVVVAFLSGGARWIPIGLAIVAVVLYLREGRRGHSQTRHDVLWVFAFSQAFAVIVAVLAFFVSWVAYALAAVLALVVIVMLIVDR